MAKFTSSHVVSGFIVPILILVVLAGGYFLILPKYRESKTQQAVLAERELTLSQRQEEISDIESLVAELENKQNDLEPLNEALPPAPRIPELLANLEFIVQQSGLLNGGINLTIVPELATSPAGVSPDQASVRLARLVTSSRDLGVIRVDLSMVGTYGGFKSFLELAEHNLRIFDVQDVVLNAGENAGGQEYSIQILTYYQKQ